MKGKQDMLYAKRQQGFAYQKAMKLGPNIAFYPSAYDLEGKQQKIVKKEKKFTLKKITTAKIIKEANKFAPCLTTAPPATDTEKEVAIYLADEIKHAMIVAAAQPLDELFPEGSYASIVQDFLKKKSPSELEKIQNKAQALLKSSLTERKNIFGRFAYQDVNVHKRGSRGNDLILENKLRDVYESRIQKSISLGKKVPFPIYNIKGPVRTKVEIQIIGKDLQHYGSRKVINMPETICFRWKTEEPNAGLGRYEIQFPPGYELPNEAEEWGFEMPPWYLGMNDQSSKISKAGLDIKARLPEKNTASASKTSTGLPFNKAEALPVRATELQKESGKKLTAEVQKGSDTCLLKWPELLTGWTGNTPEGYFYIDFGKLLPKIPPKKPFTVWLRVQPMTSRACPSSGLLKKIEPLEPVGDPSDWVEITYKNYDQPTNELTDIPIDNGYYTKFSFFINSVKCIDETDKAGQDKILISGITIHPYGLIFKHDIQEAGSFDKGDVQTLEWKWGSFDFSPYIPNKPHVQVPWPRAYVILLTMGEENNRDMEEMFEKLITEITKIIWTGVATIGELAGGWAVPIAAIVNLCIDMFFSFLIKTFDNQDNIINTITCVLKFDSNEASYINKLPGGKTTEVSNPNSAFMTYPFILRFEGDGGIYEVEASWKASAKAGF